MLTYKIPPLSPYVTYEEYSRLTGLPMGTSNASSPLVIMTTNIFEMTINLGVLNQ